MITLLVDEAYAFDYMAILEIKSQRFHSEHNTKQLSMCREHLQKQIEQSLWQEIINSLEYKNLVQVNEKVFDAVEQARYGNISAKDVDDANMERFFRKQDLQKRFFLHRLTETKT